MISLRRMNQRVQGVAAGHQKPHGSTAWLTCETEHEARAWLSHNNGDWKLAIVDLFLKEGSGLGVLKGCQHRNACAGDGRRC